MDELTEVSARGHTELSNGELAGHIWFHLRDGSAFRTVRSVSKG